LRTTSASDFLNVNHVYAGYFAEENEKSRTSATIKKRMTR
jgi:hypothetical protein